MGRPGIFRTNGTQVAGVHPPKPILDQAFVVMALAAAVAAGAAVASGQAKFLALALVALGVLAAVVSRPELVLAAWFTAILVDGRWLTYHKVGPLYVTEPLLALLAFGVTVRFLVGASDLTREQRQALRFLGWLSVLMWIPALVGLVVRTSTFDYATARNFVLILYVIFAVIAASVTDLTRSYRRWFTVVLVGSTVALLLVVTGHAGQVAGTSTGAIRVASRTFALAFGIAPIVLIAAAREGFVRSVHAIIAAVPFLVGLVFVNHRSAWLALIAAAAILFGRRLSVPVVMGLIAVFVGGLLLFSHGASRNSTLGQELTRARSIASTTDPNAEFRLKFWKRAMVKSLESPIIGSGFDPYPANIVPPQTVGFDPFPAPHNSFVAIAYRIGFIPFLAVLAMLVSLIARGFRASIVRPSPVERAVCCALTAVVVYTGVTSAFNVFLEAPYAGPLFWAAVGFLASAVYRQPFESAMGHEPAPAPALR